MFINEFNGRTEYIVHKDKNIHHLTSRKIDMNV